MVRLGYRDASPEDFIRMANAGVTLDFVQHILNSGIAGSHRPSVEDLIKLRDAGL
jgi:hypothetical protein